MLYLQWILLEKGLLFFWNLNLKNHFLSLFVIRISVPWGCKYTVNSQMAGNLIRCFHLQICMSIYVMGSVMVHCFLGNYHYTKIFQNLFRIIVTKYLCCNLCYNITCNIMSVSFVDHGNVSSPQNQSDISDIIFRIVTPRDLSD